MEQREKFSSRLGFILLSAGCAIGLGNVWRFPYVVGKYGGAAFVLIYLLFLGILGLPIMAMELSVGRASQKSAITSFYVLEPKGTKWHIFGYIATLGNYLLMMFYTTISGWMLYYFVKMVKGDFVGKTTEEVGEMFGALVQQPGVMVFWMIVVVAIGFLICSFGLQNGVEKITKAMMLSLLFILFVLVARAITLSNSAEGLHFYLKPDFHKMTEIGINEVVFAAMGQAFFTLSIGMGAIAIFGSYIDKDHRLIGEAMSITLLDTFVAVMAGLIIFPSTSAFGIPADSGPALIFITLPNVFNAMAGGRLWGSLFFLFMSFAAFSTVLAVFENIIASNLELFGTTRKKAAFINALVIMVLSVPCILGFNVWGHIMLLGEGSSILDLEDFLVSNNILPLGSLIYLAFCTSRYGWGWNHFLEEVNTGKGIQFPRWSRVYVSYILPVIVLYIFVQGYIAKFFA